MKALTSETIEDLKAEMAQHGLGDEAEALAALVAEHAANQRRLKKASRILRRAMAWADSIGQEPGWYRGAEAHFAGARDEDDLTNDCACPSKTKDRVQAGGTCGMGGCPYGGDF